MSALPVTTSTPRSVGPLPWDQAREVAHAAGRAAGLPVTRVPLPDADGTTLAESLATRTDLPAFPTSSVDGWVVRGDGPWRVVGRVLAGTVAPELAEDGTCAEIATGAMVPAGGEAIVRTEDSATGPDGRITGAPRPVREWRDPGEEARAGDELFPVGTPVTPGVIGVAASCGYDELAVRLPARAAVLIFGDELRTSGLPGDGQVRDSLGPSVPGWLRRLGARPEPARGPVEDTLDAHVEALRESLHSGVDLICTTGGTMHGPVDHLHAALAELGARYLVNTVEVRPGFPMLLSAVDRPDGRTVLVAGLPGNPQSAVVALVSLVAPALAGLAGRVLPALPEITLGAEIPGRGGHTHLALVDRAGVPLRHSASAMLRGLAAAVGFAVVPPGTSGSPGNPARLVPLPLLESERPWA